MNIERINQYKLTFNRLIESTNPEHEFYRQKIGKNISIYAGIFEKKYSLAVESQDTSITLKSTSLISLQKQDFKDNKAFIFSLNDPNLLPIFITFIVDLESVLSEKYDASFDLIYNRYLFWVRMFKISAQNISEGELLGLLNEMYLIIDVFSPKYGIEKTINAWTGPDLLHKDFTFETGIWYEAKAIKFGKKQVTINSLEQLDSDTVGYLLVTEYEKTSIDNLEAFYLSKAVQSIMEKIQGTDLLERFFNKLITFGVTPHVFLNYENELNKYKYINHGTRKFVIKDKFPRLSKDQIPVAVGNVRYDLQLDLLLYFEEKD